MSEIITLNEYKEYANKDNPKDDTTLTQIISGVNHFVKVYCGRNFVVTAREDYFDVEGALTRDIFLYEIPVISVTKVEMLQNDTYEDVTDYSVSRRTGRLTHKSEPWPEGNETVRVTYETGFNPIPEDLKLACFDLVNYYFKKEYVPRKTVQNLTKEFATKEVGLPTHISTVLNMYRLML